MFLETSWLGNVDQEYPAVGGAVAVVPGLHQEPERPARAEVGDGPIPGRGLACVYLDDRPLGVRQLELHADVHAARSGELVADQDGGAAVADLTHGGSGLYEGRDRGCRGGRRGRRGGKLGERLRFGGEGDGLDRPPAGEVSGVDQGHVLGVGVETLERHLEQVVDEAVLVEGLRRVRPVVVRPLDDDIAHDGLIVPDEQVRRVGGDERDRELEDWAGGVLDDAVASDAEATQNDSETEHFAHGRLLGCEVGFRPTRSQSGKNLRSDGGKHCSDR